MAGKRFRALLIGKPVASPSSIKILEDYFETVAYCTNEEFESDRQRYLENQDFIWIHVETRLLDSDISLLNPTSLVASTTTGTTHVPNSILSQLGGRFLCLKDERSLLAQISSTAELAWCLVLMAATNVQSAVHDVQSGRWDRSANLRKSQVSSQKIGIVGFGRLGKMLAQYARAFGCHVMIWDICPNARRLAQSDGYALADNLEDLCESSDIISLHLNTVQGGPSVITSDLLSSSTSGLSIVNTSRGSVVEEDAIISGIENGFLASYMTDVLSFEELSGNLRDSKLWHKALSDPRVVITPHIGGASLDAMEMCEHNILSRAIDVLELS